MEAKKPVAVEEGKQKVSGRLRSPSYPGIDLETALKRAREFYNLERRNAANIGVAVEHWGFKSKSSGGMVTVAALRAFGLLSDTGSGKGRKLKLTELALRILLDYRADSPERDAAIKEAALKPKIHAALWNKYATNLPSDENLRHELIWERKFNENAVGDFIKEYKETIRLAKLQSSDTISGVGEDIAEGNEMPRSDQRLSGAVEPVPPLKGSETGWMTPAGSGLPQQAKPTASTPKEISMPVGLSEDGQAVFAHIRFDAPLKKDFLVSLRSLLEALEKGLAQNRSEGGHND